MRKDLLDSERLSLSAAARRVGVHVATLVRWCLRGVDGRKLPSFKFGGRRVVLLDDLEAFLAAGAEPGTTQTVAGSSQSSARADEVEKLLDRHGI